MTWSISGTYLENCNCKAVCGCTWGGLPADKEHCYFLLVFHIDTGHIDGVDVGELTFGVLAETRQVMSEGNWRWGVLMDGAASDEQASLLQGVATGELGGPFAGWGPLTAEFLGVERSPVTYEVVDGVARFSFGANVDVEVATIEGSGGNPVSLSNVEHPANSTLTIAPATRSRIEAFGIAYGEPGTSGFTAPFAWSA